MTGAAARASGGASTRDKLIDAAFQVVARDGLEAASVKTIAAAAGVAPGLVHYHFPNKEAVLVAALRRGLDAYRAAGAARRQEMPPERQLDAFFDAARESAGAERDFFKVRLALAARAMTDPALAAVMNEVNAAAADEVARAFAAAERLSNPTSRHIALAATLKATFDGVMLAWINDPKFPIDEAADIMRRAARAYLNGD